MSFIRFTLFVFYQVSMIHLLRGAPAARILRSPCPEIFKYEKINYGERDQQDRTFPSENHRWRGVVQVTPTIPVFLKMKLLVPALLPSKYVGRIVLAEGKNEVAKKIKTGNPDKIKYYVYFPGKVPIPELILIELNSRVVCFHQSVPRRLKTVLTLEHSLMTVAVNVSSRMGNSTDPNKPVAEKVINEREDSDCSRCGRANYKNSLSSWNPSVSIGDWPWMVPLFKKTELGLQFFCSSTLISYVLIVTAAHCIKFKDFPEVRGGDIVAYVGRFDITNWTEENSQPREVSQVFIHPDFDSENLHSDLAVLKFSKPVEHSPHVAPACLWQGKDNLSAIVGKKGVVFGWGTDGMGTKITPTPKLAVMPIASQEECLRSKMEFLFLTTNRTLCAGFRNGTGPCSGDSGGGLLIPRKGEDGNVRWFLRGVVSLSLMKGGQIMCDVHEYTIFTDVAKYQNWISGLESN